MSKNFDKAYANTMKIEGGYVNDPTDRGGETYKGISRKNWPDWNGWTIIDNIKKSVGYSPSYINKAAANDQVLQRLVRLFYKEEFWDKNNLEMMPYEIAEELFDTGVNMSSTIAAKFLQEALNLCNNNQKLYADIKVDGKIGNITYQALTMSNTKRVLKTINLLQGERYLNILRNNETQEKYWGGWLERVIC